MLDCIAIGGSERQGCRYSHCGSTQQERVHAALTLLLLVRPKHISSAVAAPLCPPKMLTGPPVIVIHKKKFDAVLHLEA